MSKDQYKRRLKQQSTDRRGERQIKKRRVERKEAMRSRAERGEQIQSHACRERER